MSEVDVVNLFNKYAREVVKDKTLPEISSDTKITSLGIDSVSMLEIVGCIEDDLNIVIPDEKLSAIRTVSDIQKAIGDQPVTH